MGEVEQLSENEQVVLAVAEPLHRPGASAQGRRKLIRRPAASDVRSTSPGARLQWSLGSASRTRPRVSLIFAEANSFDEWVTTIRSLPFKTAFSGSSGSDLIGVDRCEGLPLDRVSDGVRNSGYRRLARSCRPLWDDMWSGPTAR